MVCRILIEGLTLVSSNATLVNFPQEMFNDAMHFLEEAKKLSTSSDNDFLRWRYLRASIIYSLTSLEAFVNTLIAGLIAEKLKLPNVANDFANKERMGMVAKLERIFPLITGKEIDKTKPEWIDLQTVRNIRNRLVHYTGGTEIYNDNDPYGVNISNAEKGIRMVRGMVRQLCALLGENPPIWVERIESRIIR